MFSNTLAVLESLHVSTAGLVWDSVGPRGQKYFPFLFVVLSFIVISNVYHPFGSTCSTLLRTVLLYWCLPPRLVDGSAGPHRSVSHDTRCAHAVLRAQTCVQRDKKRSTQTLEFSPYCCNKPVSPKHAVAPNLAQTQTLDSYMRSPTARRCSYLVGEHGRVTRGR